MSPVEFHPAAREELVQAAQYYQAHNPGLGRRFALAVRDAVHRIQEFPLLYPVLEGDIRRCRVLRFPYGVAYRAKQERIEVLAVMHLHRRPGYWKSRTGQD
ncbi:MAG TPA: type II toxin-antitoxin system RelE/ParE family toxin [bacterium]|nr:type II toxin-antitoxin system RelE/ParE family toxin [bacterium]